MKSRYVEVPRAALVERLEKVMGFVRCVGVGGDELVYTRPHQKDGKVHIRVYTSMSRYEDVARECGADAIRISLVVNGEGVWSNTRVHRTGTVEGVLDRMHERAKEAYAFATRCILSGHCTKCGGYTYADSGRCLVKMCRANGGKRKWLAI